MALVKQFRSISFLLQAFAGLLTALLIAFAAMFAREALINERQSKLAPVLIDIQSDFFNAIQTVRLERGTVNTALVSEQPTSGTAIRDVGKLRAQFDNSLNSGMAKLRTFPLPRLPELLEEIGKRKNSLLALRAEADAALAKPLAQRPADISARWVSSVLSMVSSLNRVTGSSSRCWKSSSWPGPQELNLATIVSSSHKPLHAAKDLTNNGSKVSNWSRAEPMPFGQ
jgi:hypothetical protein